MLYKNESKIKKILFYTTIPRAFRTTLIGHLYEICQFYPTILLSEELDNETEKALHNKELFPKLENIVFINQFTGKKRNLFNKNKYLYKLAKNVVEKYQPDIVISGSDNHSLFELYLMRFAKKKNILKIAIQPLNTFYSEIIEKWVDTINAHLRFPLFLPLWLRVVLVKFRKYFGHYLYYWILPLTVGERPFFGKSSYILRKGNSGMRDADYQIVFSKRDYDIYLKDGVPDEKLYILSHPLSRESREFFEKVYFNKLKKHEKNGKYLILLMPNETDLGVDKNNRLIVSREDREKNYLEIVKLINNIMPDWKVYVKPHPDTKNFEKIRENFKLISNNIEVVNPRDSVDKYIQIGNVIIGLPPSASTALFVAFLQCPEKPIISLDFFHELFGDTYKNFEGIEYIDTIEDFVSILEKIKNNCYQKTIQTKRKTKEDKEFSSTVEMIEFLFNNKEKSKVKIS